MNTQHSFEEQLRLDPLEQFLAWFEDARAAVEQPDAVALATATADGRPSVRMVLLKRADADGFGFHTNLESRKASELAANPHAALLCHWQPLGRQVRVEGVVRTAPVDESQEYFGTRPLGSRLAAWASPQSRPLADRAELERLYAQTVERFPQDDVPLPPHWGGFRLVPDAYEFWQHGEHRLHDRLRYERAGEGWHRQRLAP
jgi:pyridoxamine 5'-phosphate oxidase